MVLGVSTNDRSLFGRTGEGRFTDINQECKVRLVCMCCERNAVSACLYDRINGPITLLDYPPAFFPQMRTDLIQLPQYPTTRKSRHFFYTYHQVSIHQQADISRSHGDAGRLSIDCALPMSRLEANHELTVVRFWARMS